MILEQGGSLKAYEIKLAKSLRRDMAQSLLAFIKEHPVQKASILSLQEKQISLAEGIEAEHWSHIE